MGAPLQLGRYSLFAQLASGGMATVYLGRLNGEVGFGRTVAIKRLHPHLAREPEFVTMFLDEAHLATRVRHPNVVPTLDIVTNDDELFIVMEYVQGESLGALLRFSNEQDQLIPVPIAASIALGLLNGLHAAHEATDEEGRPLGIIHRDVSPQNVLVGTDGVPRLVDFGVARAATRLTVTQDGQIKGKVPYMAPEQLGGIVSRQTDIYAAGVVLWESLACRRLYRAETEAELFHKVLEARVRPPSRYNPDVTPELDQVVLRALAKAPQDRWATANDMAESLDAALRPASTMRVSEWVLRIAEPSLRKKNALVATAEQGSEGRNAFRTTGGLPALDLTRDELSDPRASVPSGAIGVATGGTGANVLHVDSSGAASPITRDPLPPAPPAPAASEGKKGRALLAIPLLLVGAVVGAGAVMHQSGPPVPTLGGQAGPGSAAPTTPLPVVPPPPSVTAVAVAPSSSAAPPVDPPIPAATAKKQDPGHRTPHPHPGSGEIQDLLDTR